MFPSAPPPHPMDPPTRNAPPSAKCNNGCSGLRRSPSPGHHLPQSGNNRANSAAWGVSQVGPCRFNNQRHPSGLAASPLMPSASSTSKPATPQHCLRPLVPPMGGLPQPGTDQNRIQPLWNQPILQLHHLRQHLPQAGLKTRRYDGLNAAAATGHGPSQRQMSRAGIAITARHHQAAAPFVFHRCGRQGRNGAVLASPTGRRRGKNCSGVAHHRRRQAQDQSAPGRQPRDGPDPDTTRASTSQR